MRNARLSICLMALQMAVTAGASQAATRWTDAVVPGWTGGIQNFGQTAMTEETTWWLTGPSDCDVDGNGIWDPVTENDYMAGWRAGGAASFTVAFSEAVEDIDGADLVIHLFSGSSALGNVLASSDGSTFVQIGTVGAGTPKHFRDEYFDFDGLIDNVHYIKLERVDAGPNTGAFFDSFAAVPEPGTIGLMMLGAAAALRRRRNG